MSAENWRELLDDEEVRNIVRIVAKTALKTRDPYLDDDIESYLWDKAVDIAMAYSPDIQADDPVRYWRGYLYQALRSQARYQVLNTYAPGYGDRREQANAKIALHTGRYSADALHEEHGDAPFTRRLPDDLDVLAVGDRGHDSPGYHRISRSDPLFTVLLTERLEAALRHARAIQAVGPTTWRSEAAGLCSDVTCFQKATKRGLCDKHYQRVRSKWGTGVGAENACANDGCERPVSARGYCGIHYKAFMRSRPEAPLCATEGCDKPVSGRGLCQYHARRAHQTGKALPPSRSERPKPTCATEGCDQPAGSGTGLCRRCYKREWRRQKRAEQ